MALNKGKVGGGAWPTVRLLAPGGDSELCPRFFESAGETGGGAGTMPTISAGGQRSRGGAQVFFVFLNYSLRFVWIFITFSSIIIRLVRARWSQRKVRGLSECSEPALATSGRRTRECGGRNERYAAWVELRRRPRRTATAVTFAGLPASARPPFGGKCLKRQTKAIPGSKTLHSPSHKLNREIQICLQWKKLQWERCHRH